MPSFVLVGKAKHVFRLIELKAKIDKEREVDNKERKNKVSRKKPCQS